MFAAGSGTRTDVDEMQARLDLNVAQLLEAHQNVDYAQQQLSVLINQPVMRLAELNVERLQLLAPNPATLAQWQALADAGSPELLALEARMQAARLQVEKSRSGHLPTLDLVAQWSISDSENVTRLDSSYNTRSVGVQLSVPLYAGGYVNSTVRQALAEQVRAEETLEAARRDLQVRIHKEFRGVTEGVLLVKALEQAVRSAEQAAISTRKSSLAGVRTQLDVLKAEAQKVESLRDLARARYGYLLSKLRLQSLAGMAGSASIDEINVCLNQ
jgi:outer membrane protein/protease secretion system outer membrane protein